MKNTNAPPIILGSSSVYRRRVLETLDIPFEVCSPDIDETTGVNEHPQSMVKRLAKEKAYKVAETYPNALIIACDQVCNFEHRPIGKPGDYDTAFAMLRKLSGQKVSFFNGVCVLNSDSGSLQTHLEEVKITFRHLTHEQIETYLKHDQPYHSAGALKSETLGIALLSDFSANDPYALIGLPLIPIITMLANEGVDILSRVVSDPTRSR